MRHAGALRIQIRVDQHGLRAVQAGAHHELELALAAGALEVVHLALRHAHHAANAVARGVGERFNALEQLGAHVDAVQRAARHVALRAQPGLHFGRFDVFHGAVWVRHADAVQHVHRGVHLQGGC